jgi:hypothetical protein
MIRGTTAQFKFKLPYIKAELRWVTIKFWQPGNLNTLLPITKNLEHCDAPEDSTELYVSLTAEETSRFSEDRKAKVQLRAQAIDGTVFGCPPKLIPVYPMRDDIIEENPELPPENYEGWVIFDGKPIV